MRDRSRFYESRDKLPGQICLTVERLFPVMVMMVYED